MSTLLTLTDFLRYFSLYSITLRCFLFLIVFSFAVPGHSTEKASLTGQLLLAESLKEQGKLPQALNTLHSARSSVAIKSREHTLIMGMIANIHILQRRYDEAFLVLTETQPLAEKNGWSYAAADQASFLANLFQRQLNTEKALRWYEKTRLLAQKSGDERLLMQTQINLGRLNLAQNKVAEAGKIISNILRHPSNSTSIKGNETQLNLARLLLDFLPFSAQSSAQYKQSAFKLLTDMLEQSSLLSAPVLSQTYGLLSELYQMENRYEEAISLLQKAVFSAQQHPDLLYQWQWQLGTAYKRLGETQRAFESLERAVRNVEAIRQDIPVDYVDGRSSFRQTLEPLYLELTDVLLKRASESSQYDDKQYFLAEARNTMELLKRSELEDYFDNRCVIENKQEVDLGRISNSTAAIYPIMFPDRLELLVSFAQRIEQKTIAVSAEEIAITATELASRFRSLEPGWQSLSSDIYHWLFTPIESLLIANNIDTLIYLPDGPLRLVPIASLYNGEKFLIEEFSVATSPGLTLFDATQTDKSDLNILMAGLSAPGPVVDDVSERLYAAINVATNSNVQQQLINQNARQGSNQQQSRRLSYPRPQDDDDKNRDNGKEQSAVGGDQLRIVSKRTPDGQLIAIPDDLRLISKRPGVQPNRPGFPEIKDKLKRKLRIVNKFTVSDKKYNNTGSSPLRIVAKHNSNHDYQIAKARVKSTTTPLVIVSKTPAFGTEEISNAKDSNEEQAEQLIAFNKNSLFTSIAGPLKVRKRSVPKDEGVLQLIKENRITRLKQRLKLPGVDEEIANIAALYDGVTLVNEGFNKSEFVNELLHNRYDIIHIASHGVFGDSAENSFVMTHDELLDMNQLEVLLSNEKFDKAPVELITLSACQTADGDDRAPLGISGIALRAKVRSALGALWAVSDAATVELMSAFYLNLQKPGMTKAQALREAQVSMLQQDKYRHPFFWSAFILIGNWL